jgi:SAM-dependent methyltransferase
LKENKTSFKDYIGVDLSEGLLEEASILHPEARFLHLDMLNLDSIKEQFSNIFFIASFHHLDNLEDRIKVLRKVYDLLKD